GLPVVAVEDLTEYPSILGGRVKTLHPKIFGGILGRRENTADNMQLIEYNIPVIDLVIVDLYPFSETVASGAKDVDIIEKIDIGGISLIRAAAKNFNDVLIIPSRNDYDFLLALLKEKKGYSSLADRKKQAAHAFKISSQYDTSILNYFQSPAADFPPSALRPPPSAAFKLRYGENPHQSAVFYGNLDEVFEQLNGKELSYNNLLDVDAALALISDFDECTFAIIKHNNACGIASRTNPLQAWKDALAGDPVSAFGGIIVTNKMITADVAEEINKLFFEILIAPSFEEKALTLLKEKKNRILLKLQTSNFKPQTYRSLLNGVIEQDKDLKTENISDMQTVTNVKPTESEIQDMIFANKIVKHSKSNAIVLAKNKQLLASGVGQTSRVDALKQAIEKAGRFGFDLKGAVMASDAFFPFPDCVEIAHRAGISAVIQPGGSVRDKESVDYCNKNAMTMVLTGTRHFKH
ncbi:MAG TPA: bifunctional phosphoribosylaminoimidazolecarboxamide formyltransferase/IMP cyclohydrolase, partial [Bacteroidia bacterium]|nr:bifunctional phosphoribosylaminoimidazolecarboxamide formyltransferase/IMP cyclohydrolase [Bacteroidia bacterium]